MENLRNIFAENSDNTYLQLACILTTACLMMTPVAFLGIPENYDLAQHIRFAMTYHDSILRGDLFPGWAGLENGGFGSIGIRYYPPVAYYLLAFTQLLTGDWYDSIWINCLFWMAVSGVGVYFWIKEISSGWQAVFTAVVYIIIPYHVSQIYQLFLFAEFAAAAILPFCFWFATRLIKRGNFFDVLLFSIAFSLLILTHIPTTIIGSISLGIYVLFLIDWKDFKKILINFAIAFGLCVSATAFHLIRLISEVNWVKHNSSQFYSSGFYDYKKFLFPLYLSDTASYIKKLLWVFDLQIIFCVLLFIPMTIFLLKRSNKDVLDSHKNKFFNSVFFTGLFSIFIMTIPSSFIWDNFSLLQKIQFPWRWQSIASLLGSISFTFGISFLILRFRNLKKFFLYITIFIILVFSIFNVTQNIIVSTPLSREKFSEKLIKMQDEIGCNCWWTTWADNSAFNRSDKINIESRNSESIMWENENREFKIEAGTSSGNVRIATFYHPYWKAKVNENPVKVEADQDGSILIPVPAETSNVKMYFSEPLKNDAAVVLSLLAWAFILGILIWFYRTPANDFEINTMKFRKWLFK